MYLAYKWNKRVVNVVVWREADIKEVSDAYMDATTKEDIEGEVSPHLF